jgi:hypothetical protein
MYSIEIGEVDFRGSDDRQVLLVKFFKAVAGPNPSEPQVTVETDLGPMTFPVKFDVF